MAQHNPFSVYSNNCNELANKCSANFYLFTNRIANESNNSINEINVSNVNILKEMIDIRDGRMVCVNCQEKMLYILYA